MAMKPFCGYNYADYFAHWLSLDKAGAHLPKIFHVNWFRKGADGAFLWPGYGDNLRVLEWIIGRCDGAVQAEETPIGRVPRKRDLDLDGLHLSDAAVQALLDIDLAGWQREVDDIGRYLDSFGSRMPAKLRSEQHRVAAALDASAATPMRTALAS
jgi:phosphoenolpyruvate carboxykinase (GTP)